WPPEETFPFGIAGQPSSGCAGEGAAGPGLTGAPDGGPAVGRVRRLRAVRTRAWPAFSVYLCRHGRGRRWSSEHSERPPATVTIDRRRPREAGLARRLPRIRTVIACPARRRYRWVQRRARCRSTEHIGRPPLMVTVTFWLAAWAGALPVARWRQT